MKKFIALLFAGALTAAAGLVLSPADAEETCQDVEIGVVCADGDAESQTGHITADGDEGNPEPIDGYASASNDGSQDEDGICVSSEGDPGEETDENGDPIEDSDEEPACDEEIPQAVADYITGGGE